jgi:hypothetical protein
MNQENQPSLPLGQGQRDLQRTIALIECTLLILTDLLNKFDNHNSLDVWDVTIFLLRQISDVQFQLLMLE